MGCSGNRTFFTFRLSCILMIAIALTLQGISLRKDAKWDQYITGAIEVDEENPTVYQVNAYQSLWGLTVINDYDTQYANEFNVYKEEYTKNTEWREEVLRYELAGIGLASISVCVLVIPSLVPFFLTIRKVQIGCILGSMSLCIICAALILKGVVQYSQNYQTILNPKVKRFEWFYHMTDNTLAMDFYFAFGAAIFQFFGGVALTIHLIMYARFDDRNTEGKVESICI